MQDSVALLLLSLLVLSTGSESKRIRKRGLNHKVRLIHSPLAEMSEFLSCLCFSIQTRGESSTLALLDKTALTLWGQICSRGERRPSWPKRLSTNPSSNHLVIEKLCKISHHSIYVLYWLVRDFWQVPYILQYLPKWKLIIILIFTFSGSWNVSLTFLLDLID